MSEKLKCGNISDEKSRCYTIYSLDDTEIHRTAIVEPKSVHYGKGHAFHRVFDGVQTILCPAPGFIWGECGDICGYCELSWKPRDKENPCQW